MWENSTWYDALSSLLDCVVECYFDKPNWAGDGCSELHPVILIEFPRCTSASPTIPRDKLLLPALAKQARVLFVAIDTYLDAVLRNGDPRTVNHVWLRLPPACEEEELFVLLFLSYYSC